MKVRSADDTEEDVNRDLNEAVGIWPIVIFFILLIIAISWLEISGHKTENNSCNSSIFYMPPKSTH